MTTQHLCTLLHPVSLKPKKVYFLETFFPCDPRRWIHARSHVLPQLRQLLRVRQPGSSPEDLMNVSSVTAPERIGLSL